MLNTPMTYVEIGERLFISPRTVESHVDSLRRKLGATNRRELAWMWADSQHDAGLPAELSSFVGRESELGQTLDALAHARLVTLTGPGGVGKTRLAVRVARRWMKGSSGRCWYVDLVPLPPGAGVAPAVAAACRAAASGGVETAIAARLSGAPALLVLDNTEHVLDASARLIETLLTRCPELRVLVTSRVRLVLPHERVVVVPGLGEGANGAAVVLFRERAGVLALDGDPVAAVCAALGGLPLAIELAVARLGTLGLSGLEASLGRQLDTLRGGARVNARNRSLQETIGWSYDLLPRPERGLLAQVSIFAEPFTTASAEEVLAGPVAARVAVLCEHSLLRLEGPSTEPRYRLLEAVREFGRHRLSDAQHTQLAERHAGWALRNGSVAERLAAAEWCAGPGANAALAHELWRTLAGDYFRAGRLRDAQGAHERDATVATGLARADALTDAAAVARCRVLGEEATRLDLLAVEALFGAGADSAAAEALARVADHAVRFAGMFAAPLPSSEVDAILGRARHHAGNDRLANAALAVARVQTSSREATDPVARSRAAFEQAERAGAVHWIGGALDALCVALVETGQVAEAAELSLQRAERTLATDDPRLALEVKDALHTGTQILTGAGRLADAQQLAERHLRMPWLRTETDLASEEMFLPAALSGEWSAALDRCEGYLAAWQRAGRPIAPGRAMAPLAVALIHRLRGDEREHARWRGAASMMGGHGSPSAYEALFAAVGLLHDGDPVGAIESLKPPQSGFYGRLIRAWSIALRFEAEVLLGAATAEPALEPNPVATLIVARAAALRSADTAAALATRDGFAQLGCPYQAARTLLLANGR